jgi:hypothetical protein
MRAQGGSAHGQRGQRAQEVLAKGGSHMVIPGQKRRRWAPLPAAKRRGMGLSSGEDVSVACPLWRSLYQYVSSLRPYTYGYKVAVQGYGK